MVARESRLTTGYAAVLLAAFTVAMLAGWSSLAARMDGDAYDWMFRLQPPRTSPASSIVLAIDERTLAATGGMRNLRGTIAKALGRISLAKPVAVAIDIILFDEGDPLQDAALEAALQQSSNLILATDLLPGAAALQDEGRWQDPLARFRRHARAVGHIYAAPDPISRVLPLEHAGTRERRWAMALEAYRIAKGGADIVEEPRALQLDGVRIPASRDTARGVYIRYREGVPTVSVQELLTSEAAVEQVRGKVVFLGVTAQTAARDRLMTPFERMMSGVEIHAQGFETLMDGVFFKPASNLSLVLLCAAITVAAGAIFATLSGWAAYAAGVLLLGAAHAAPHIAFSNGIIFPYVATIWVAWLSVVVAASWQHFVVRRQLLKSESDRARYQEAIHFVTHEMRSPLTAIQGSSELMGRYNLNDDKRKQIANTINSESKRLARMIQTFLDVERLSDGQMDVRSDIFELREVLDSCVARVGPLAERKQIRLDSERVENLMLQGDRELMEYAVYNLLTNAVKYSPAGTVVTISMRGDGRQVRLSVRDQGIGIDEKELRNIFKKFYRTKKAESSGEAGTGIGLSIVEQIVTHHGGRMEVTSTPAEGSCFTMVLPSPASKLVSQL